MFWAVFKTAFAEWLRHRSPRLGAALAYYSVFSMGPLLLLVTAIAGVFFGHDAVRGRLTDQFRGLLGRSGSQAIEAMLAGAASEQTGRIAAITSVILLIVAAVGVVAQLKDAMNTIWNVAETDDAGLWWHVRNYLVSFAGILALGFLLIVSLVVSTVLSAIGNLAGSQASGLLQFANFVASTAIIATMFAMLFKWFPDADIAWRDVWPGAVTTALLFEAGKQLIGWYIGTQGFESTYGAAASIIVLLVWVYYSAQIMLFGAELTHAYAVEKGSMRGKAPEATTEPKV